MKIAVLHNLPSGGARRALIEHCRGLRGRGHWVEAFYPDTADEAFLPLEPVVDRVHVWRAPRPPNPEPSILAQVRAGSAWAALRLVRGLARIHRDMAQAIDAGGFDVVLAAHDQYTHAPRALRHLTTPAAYFCQEPLRFVYEAPVGLAMPAPGGPVGRAMQSLAIGAAKWVLRPVDARSVRAATLVLANSVYSHESIMRAYGRAARVVYLGVDTARFRPLGLERTGRVLTVGALHPAKGFDFVVDALAQIPASRRPALDIVSDRAYGAYRALLESRARARGVRLQIHARVSENELVEWYNRAQLLAYAPYLEPFGLASLEAMACGTPVVAVAEGGTRESIRSEETGLLTMRDVSAFASAIDRILRDPGLAARLAGAAAAEIPRRWTWTSSSEQLEVALDACRACRGGGSRPG